MHGASQELYDGYSSWLLRGFAAELESCRLAEEGTAQASAPRPPAHVAGMSRGPSNPDAHLSPFPAGRLDLVAVRAMAAAEGHHELVPLLRMLDDPAAFRARMVEPFCPWGAPSRGMRRYAPTLLREGIARVCPRGALRGMVKIFTVPKSDPAWLG